VGCVKGPLPVLPQASRHSFFRPHLLGGPYIVKKKSLGRKILFSTAVPPLHPLKSPAAGEFGRLRLEETFFVPPQPSSPPPFPLFLLFSNVCLVQPPSRDKSRVTISVRPVIHLPPFAFNLPEATQLRLPPLGLPLGKCRKDLGFFPRFCWRRWPLNFCGLGKSVVTTSRKSFCQRPPLVKLLG